MNDLLDKLLALPDPNSEEGLAFDYAALAANEEDVETTLRFLTNSDELDELDDDQWDHVQIYSYRSLGERAEMRFFDTFVEVLRSADACGSDQFCDEFGELMRLIGAGTVPPLLAILSDPDETEQFRSTITMALDTLATIADVRDTIIDAYAGHLESQHNTRLLNAFVAASLVDLNAVQHAPVICDLYQANLIDVTMLGDLEGAEIVLGLRDTRSTPKPNLSELERTLVQQARRKELGPLPDPGDHLAILNYFIYLHQTPRSMISVSQLDGFLLACLCAPQTIPPSAYLPWIWDREGDPDSGPAWNSEDELRLFMEALMRLNNANAQALQGEDFAPIAYLEESGQQTLERFQSWAIGAIDGISLWETKTPATKNLSNDLATSLLEIVRLESEDKGSTPDISLPALYDALSLFMEAYDDHRNHLAGGPDLSPRYLSDHQPHKRESLKIGRNDPCPCGSGKKYKKCCMD